MKWKKVFLVVSVLYVILILISCSKNMQNGPLGVNLIQLTFTPTCTPDSPYTIFLNQEGTPVKNVNIVLRKPDTGVTLTAKTNSAGIAVLNVHSAGQWILDVDTFDGFEGQRFTVEPLSNTYNALNYGLPSLELKLKSGSELIPMSPSVIEYEVIYHTKYPRPVNVTHNAPTALNILGNGKMFRINGDSDVYKANIPKSFEGYTDNNKKNLAFKFSCKSPFSTTITDSTERNLVKKWSVNITADFVYVASKNGNDNNGKVSFYASIRNVVTYVNEASVIGAIKYALVFAINDGDAGPGVLVSMQGVCNGNNCVVAAKLLTNADESYAYGHQWNYGYLTVRIYDDKDLDIQRTFTTTNGWSIPCFSYSCSILFATSQNNLCTSANVPFATCPNMKIKTVSKNRAERVNITK